MARQGPSGRGTSSHGEAGAPGDTLPPGCFFSCVPHGWGVASTGRMSSPRSAPPSFRPAPAGWRQSRPHLVAWAALQLADYLDKSAPVADGRPLDQVWKQAQVSTRRGRRIAAIAVAPIIRDQLQQVQARVAEAIAASGGDPQEVDRVLAHQEDAWRTTLREVYLEAGVPAARRVAAAIDRVAKRGQRAVELGPGDASWVQAILDWLAQNSSEKITAILETSREAVRQLLTEGNAAGETIRQLVDRITGVDSTVFSRERAEVIARTESLTAYSVGGNAAAVESGVDMTKAWACLMDGRQRPTHGQANGQQRALKDPYSVGGYDLMFPGDSSLGAPAGETIQCRCTELYIPLGEGR